MGAIGATSVARDIEDAEKLMGTVILRSQQATKNLQLLEIANTDPSLLLRMTA
jgi:hypothetical protein